MTLKVQIFRICYFSALELISIEKTILTYMWKCAFKLVDFALQIIDGIISTSSPGLILPFISKSGRINTGDEVGNNIFHFRSISRLREILFIHLDGHPYRPGKRFSFVYSSRRARKTIRTILLQSWMESKSCTIHPIRAFVYSSTLLF